MSSRLFIAAEIPLLQRENLLRIRDEICENEYCNFKWEPIEKLHMTIKFLGDTEEKLIPNIESELSEINTEFNKFEASFSRFGLFYRDRVPSVLWAGLFCDYSLKIFADKIQDEMTSLGFPRERRKFKPHITLSRLKNLPQNIELNGFHEYKFADSKFFIEEIVLYKSELRRSGSVYEKLKTFPL